MRFSNWIPWGNKNRFFLSFSCQNLRALMIDAAESEVFCFFGLLSLEGRGLHVVMSFEILTRGLRHVDRRSGTRQSFEVTAYFFFLLAVVVTVLLCRFKCSKRGENRRREEWRILQRFFARFRATRTNSIGSGQSICLAGFYIFSHLFSFSFFFFLNLNWL